MPDTTFFAEQLKTQPVFAVTADLDWASEDCVAALLKTCAEFAVTPTLFMTHDSAMARQAAVDGRAELGIHPNFLAHSSHGVSPDEIVQHVLRFAPQSIGCRTHAYANSTHISRALVAAGMRYESSPVYFLQSELRPLLHWSGLLHLPVFWEDDVHWTLGQDWNFEAMRAQFLTPGLKILDIHPFFQMLNIPDAAFYAQHKPLIETLTRDQAKSLRHAGEGCSTFLRQILTVMRDLGQPARTLGEIYRDYTI